MAQSIRFAMLLALSPIAFAELAGAEDAATDAPQAQAPAIPHVTVLGNKESDDYRVQSTDSLGPLGSLKILDAPYSIGVLPEELIQNSMATNFKDV
jgi:iron complex outermembrane receptor protein